jgi:hypothetical protein
MEGEDGPKQAGVRIGIAAHKGLREERKREALVQFKRIL